MTSTYPPLPSPVPQQAHESAYVYGTRLLAWIIEHEVTATLSDNDLELIVHTSMYATMPHDLHVVTLSAVTKIRHICHAVLKERKQSRVQPAVTVPCVTPSKPNDGPMARLSPVPRTNPPVGVGVKPEINF